jgi:tetratricopeptide (TPR) repeat protein
MKWILLLFAFFFSNLQAENEMDNLQIFKSYLQNEQFDLAKEMLEFTEFDSTLHDSFALQKTLLFQKTGEWEKAIDSTIEILAYSENDSLQHASIPVFQELLPHLSPVSTIEKITAVIKQTNNAEIRREFLVLLASVYERNHLFGEAKDVYYVLLNDSTQVDTMNIFLNIIHTDISLQKFATAIHTIDSLSVSADSLYLPDLQFLQFISYYSANEIKSAKKILMNLYIEYPDFKNRNEIIEALAEIYYDEQQYLLSWYFWNKLYEISSAYKKMTILKTLQEVKESLVNDSLATEQFKFFQPVFEEKNEKER